MRALRLAALAALVLAPVLTAAQITVTPRGDAATLDVASWNLEFFGTTSPTDQPDSSPNDDFQFRYVKAVVAQSGIDVWGFQEVSDGGDFNRLVDSLAADGYGGVLGPNVSTPNEPFDQKLAFVYDMSAVTVLGTATLFDGESLTFRGQPQTVSYVFAGRLPLEMRTRVVVGGAMREVRFIVIHAKSSRDPLSYDRRAAAATRLKTYTDGLIAAGEAVVILGDFNDMLESASRGSSFDSPYRPFVDDTAYGKATLETERAGLTTFCSRPSANDPCPGPSSGPSTIDHILFSGPTLTFLPAVGNPQRQRYGELISELPQYTATTSDHVPVLANLSLSGAVALGDGPEAGPVALLAAAPNPFRAGTRLRFRLDVPAEVQLDVFDALGRRVASLAGAFGAGEHPVPLDGAALAPGVYAVRLAAAGVVRTQLVVRAE